MSKLQDGYFGNYRGTVKKHGENGYCKIFFRGIYPEEYEKNIEKLPWAEPAQPLFAGGALGNGVFQYPDIDSTVWAFFEAGNINYPIFFALTNNDKNKFIQDEFIIHYDKSVIKFDKSNNITITADQYYAPNSDDNTDNTTGIGSGKGTITLNADKISFNSRLLDITAHDRVKVDTSEYLLSSNTTTMIQMMSLYSKAPISTITTNSPSSDSLVVGAITGVNAGSRFYGSLYINDVTYTNYSPKIIVSTQYYYDNELDDSSTPGVASFNLSTPINLNVHRHVEPFANNTPNSRKYDITSSPAINMAGVFDGLIWPIPY